MSNIQRVINFSGGKTSAYMTIHEYKEGDLVIFCDTGREHDKTYKFINDFEAHENIPVIRLKYMNSEDPFKKLLLKSNYNILPNRVKRICTSELKIKTQKRYLKTLGILRFENLIGFRADEPLRVKRRTQKFKKVTDKFPLFDKGITKEMINEYWNNKPYTLEIPSILGNCDLCFLKGKNAIMSIMQSFPELADKWIEDEEYSKQVSKSGGRTYFEDISYKQLRELSKNNLFKDYNLNDIKPAFDCACTS